MPYQETKYSESQEATHKPRISFVNDSIGTCFKCTDGGVTYFGNTPQEAFDGLQARRGF